MVITALTRNQVVAQAARGFESHRFRQRNALLFLAEGRFFLHFSAEYRKLSYEQYVIAVINNVRWGTEETWIYCWDGVPHHSIVAVGTVASGLKLLENRPLFENGLDEMVRVLQPHTIIVYGSANYECFNKLKAQGINIVAFPSQTSIAFERRKDHE